MPIGKIEPFVIGTHNWDAYCRRIKQFIALNNIAEELHVATLVTHVGIVCYELMCDLCSPVAPETKSFDELELIVKEHLEPQRSEIAERHVFRQRKQGQDESINEYLQSLKHLAKTCNFGTTLEVNLRDQFVSGLHHEDMRSRLFAERELDYKRAVELALALEAADRHAALAASGASSGGTGAGSATEGMHRVARARGSRWRAGGSGGDSGAARAPGGGSVGAAPAPNAGGSGGGGARCTRCGKEGHGASRCRFKMYTCDRCGEKGHLKAVCRKSQANKGQFFLNESSSESDLDFFMLSCKGNDEPYCVNIMVENRMIKFEIDTGSKISAISKSCYEKWFSHLKLVNKELRLKSYTGNIISPLGYITVSVTFCGIRDNLKLFVIENGGPPLLGRTWIRCLNLNTIPCHSLAESTNYESIDMLRKEFPEVFADGLGTYNKSRIQLHLRDTTPVFVKARPLPLAMRGPVERELERLQREGVIYKVDRSDYGTPIVPIVKKNGSIRICGDYKVTINPLLKDFHYPLPRIEDVFANLAGGEQFTKLDLTNAYQQALLSEESQPMTAITTHVGTFIYRRVPFGIKCIPENFQKLIEEALSGLPSTVVFQDDICITGKDKKTHLENLRAVLSRLQDTGLRVNWSKCEFFQDSVTYLGYRIDKQGLHTDNKKIEAIVAAPTPKDVTQLKSFLGLTNFYSKFCVNSSDILQPLYNLLKKDVKWYWSDQCELAFNKIKNVLSKSPALAHYDATLPVILSVDSSAYGLGAMLAHRYPDGSERPISCASRTLNAAERNYSQLDKEALAIVFGVSKHHQYLYGRHFLLRSDHRALSYIFGKNKGIPQTAASRLQRYAVRLAAYNFDIEFIPSKKNYFADALSRLPLAYSVKESCNNHTSYLNFIEDKLPITFQAVKKETKRDSQLNKIAGFIKFGWPDRWEDEKDKIYFLKKENLFLEHVCLVWGYRIVIPPTLRSTVLEELHSGHIGIIKMKQIARNYVWWEGLDADIERICRECPACAAQRDQPPPAPLHSWAWPTERWSRLNIDFLGPYHNKYFLVLIDAHSKWIEVDSVFSTSATSVIACLRKNFARFGIPKSIVSDNGPPFSSAEYLKYLDKNGIKRILVAPYHPSSNGAAENAVRTIKQVLKKATLEGVDYNEALCKFLFSYRNTEHCTTQKEPAVALLGHRLRGRLDLLRPTTQELVREQQDRQESRRDGKMREIAPGEAVLMREYNVKDRKWKDGTVVKKSGPVSYVVKAKEGERLHKRHIDQIISKSAPKSRYSISCINNPGMMSSQTGNDFDNHETDGWSTPLNQSPSTSIAMSPNANISTSRSHKVHEAQLSAPESIVEQKNDLTAKEHRTFGPLGMTLRPRKKKD